MKLAMSFRALLAAAGMALCGCNPYIEPSGPVEHDSRSVELDDSQLATVEIRMSAGELRVEGGSPKLMDADFTYNIPSWKPVVHSSSSSLRQRVTVEQRGDSWRADHAVNEWEVRLNDKRPLELLTRLGAGQVQMNLGSLDLASLEIEVGAGELRLDLRGEPQRDYRVKVKGGAGQATIYLPASASVDARVTGGIGSISARGLEKHGDRWINSAREHSAATIHLDVTGGVGDVRLVAE